MKIRSAPFNIYLLVVLVGVVFGCRTTEERKLDRQASTMRFFLDSGRDSHNNGVAIYRQNPIRVSLESQPFLTEGDVDSAALIDLPGGYAIRVQFNGHGAMVLEGATVAHRGRHIGVQSDFGETRWLAAPVITRRISNGEFVFTPDATREESERIVRGLNNLIAKFKKRSIID
jgi:hypothetical protein